MEKGHITEANLNTAYHMDDEVTKSRINMFYIGGESLIDVIMDDKMSISPLEISIISDKVLFNDMHRLAESLIFSKAVNLITGTRTINIKSMFNDDKSIHSDSSNSPFNRLIQKTLGDNKLYELSNLKVRKVDRKLDNLSCWEYYYTLSGIKELNFVVFRLNARLFISEDDDDNKTFSRIQLSTILTIDNMDVYTETYESLLNNLLMRYGKSLVDNDNSSYRRLTSVVNLLVIMYLDRNSLTKGNTMNVDLSKNDLINKSMKKYSEENKEDVHYYITNQHTIYPYLCLPFIFHQTNEDNSHKHRILELTNILNDVMYSEDDNNKQESYIDVYNDLHKRLNLPKLDDLLEYHKDMPNAAMLMATASDSHYKDYMVSI